MYLKKLQLVGFKSFVNPVYLEFAEGISAIVGPNGSGKSNITDAIKWVLGEQSIKSLRGKKMEDVIFAGTDKRPPAGHAEVVLTLDNADGKLQNYPQELVISRKLFRSGESEYAINKRKCKLKEIHSIFMDTGLGKNGYSLISQGSIESILAGSPTELRAILEEAVGIVSYKTKKEEAEKKLEQTQVHLDRLRDILSEIEKQVDPLKRQSDKAKEWLVLHKELRTLELVNFYQKMSAGFVELNELRKNLKQQVEKRDAIEESLSEKDALYQKLTNENRALDNLSESDRKNLSELTSDFDRSAHEEIRCKSQLESAKSNRERLESEHTSLSIQIQETLARIEHIVSEENALSEKFEIQKALTEAQNKCLQETLKAENDEKERLKAIRDVIETHQDQCAELELRRMDLRTSIQEVRAETSIIEEHLEKLDMGQEQDIAELSVEEVARDALDVEKRTWEEKLGQLRAQLQQEKDTQNELQNELHLLANNLKVNVSKVEYLKNIQKSFQDYFPAIRKLMASEKMLGAVRHEVYGPVGELLSTDAKYIQAIDTALGAKSQNIVVSGIKAARECINLLKKERLGRATFLPMDNLKFSTIDAKTQQSLAYYEGVEGIASDLVTVDPVYDNVIKSLLGRIVVARDFDSGREIYKKMASRFAVVTLEGEIFYPGGAIVGGQTKDNRQSPLSKRVEILHLEGEMADYRKALDSGKKKHLLILKDLEEKADEIKTVEDRLAICMQALWEKNKSIENLLEKKEETRNLRESSSQKLSLLQQRCEALEIELSDVEKVYQEKKEAAKKEEDEGDETETIRQRLDTLRLEISEKQIILTQMRAEKVAFEQQLNLMREQLAQQEEKKTMVGKEIEDNHRKSTELVDRQKYLEKECERLAELIEINQNKDEEAKMLRKENLERLEKLQEEIKEENHRLISENDKKNTCSSKLDSLQLQMDHWEESMYKTYEINVLMAEDEYKRLKSDQVLDELDLSEERGRYLKDKINRLGNVNQDAIEEYEEIVKRHLFFKEQTDDLKAGKNELLDIIASLYEAMTEQFKTNFIKLQENFTRIFGILFEGGRAYLEFTDPNGVLEGGVELVAQPPGKRLRHISLLSGGEKSMVAIALLFSFLEINPSPFCVIDEIDAALDDHNIYRYINYLKKASETNQFIAITHRRTTLEVCDNLYGVSMSRDGMSQLVSVKLTDYV